jgi:phage terminase small subunit
MTERQREIWARILADAPHGLLRRIDGQLLVNYVELVDRHERAAIAQRQVDDAAETAPLLSRNGGISPYLKIMNHCVMLMSKLQSEPGFTPSARAALGMSALPSVEEPASEHERFDVIVPNGERIPYGARRPIEIIG